MSFNQKLNILLVDDDPATLQILERILIQEGYGVIIANNGSEARRCAIEHRPDLVLLDVMMPGEDGFHVIEGLKKAPHTSTIPVIFLSGRDELDFKMKSFDLGAVDYITKPFYRKEVIARVRLHLKLSLATNSLISSQAERLKQIQKAQASMLVKPEDLPNACFGVYYAALFEAGGDFYDVFKISEGIYGYFVADISGHDIETSYMTSAVKALLKQNCIPIYQPIESMRMINNVLMEVLIEGKYLTACYARLNRKTKRMTIVNGGHPPALYVSKHKDIRLIETPGDVLGVFKDVCFGVQEIRVEEGDRFFLYTDGLIESPENGRVWTDGLADLLEKCGDVIDVPIIEASERLKDIMREKEATYSDDIVVMGIEV